MNGLRRFYLSRGLRHALSKGARQYLTWCRDYAEVEAERQAGGGTWFMAARRFYEKTGKSVCSYRPMRPIMDALGVGRRQPCRHVTP